MDCKLKKLKVLPCYGGSKYTILMFETAKVNMHHLVIVDYDVDGAKWVTQIFHLKGMVRHRHISLWNIIQLLSELKFLGRS